MKKVVVIICLVFVFVNLSWTQEWVKKDTQVILTEQVYFLFAKDQIPLNEAEKLQKLVRAIPIDMEGYIRVVGHTDSIGNFKNNEELSRRRVDAVIQYLVKENIPRVPFYSQYKGEYMPMASNALDDGRQQNRRVEIQVYQILSQKMIEEETILEEIAPELKPNPSSSSIRIKIMDEESKEIIHGKVIYKKQVSDDEQEANPANENGEVVLLFPNIEKPFELDLSFYLSGYFHDSKKIKIEPNQQEYLEVFLKPIKEGSKLSLKKIFFYGNQSKLLPSSIDEMKRLKKSLLLNPNVVVEIGGHINYPNTHPKDVPEWSVRLAERRAEVVYQYLIDSGIKPSRLEHKGYSNTEMVFPRATVESQMALNRRVEVKVLKILED